MIIFFDEAVGSPYSTLNLSTYLYFKKKEWKM